MSKRLSLLPVGIFMLAAQLVGCAPAPSAQFIDQAQRLHDSTLGTAALHDRDLSDYVGQVGQRIIAGARAAAPDQTASPFYGDVRFVLVRADVPNIVPTGGRYIYLYSGLVSFCTSEEELAAAMAHAYAHLINLDVERSGLTPDPARLPRADVWQFVTHRFTPEQELRADRLAYAIYTGGGWDPARFEFLYQRLRDRYPNPADAGRPPLSTRAQLAHDLTLTSPTANRRPPVADPKTFLLLRRTAASLAQSKPVSPETTLLLLALPNCLLPYDLPEQKAAVDALRPPPTAAKLEPS